MYDLLLGSYEHILEKILNYLDGPAIECCLHVSQAWHNYILNMFQTLRFSSSLRSHWAEFVPHQKEIKYDRGRLED